MSKGSGDDHLINLDQGDPTMYESYWKEMTEKYDISITFSGCQALSYFSNPKSLCWFMEPKLEEEIKRLHNNVGNAVVKDRHIVVGTGSSQLVLAALYALCGPLNEPNPIDVLSASPYYSTYGDMIDYLQSRLFKWSGDAQSFDKDGVYIEIVTSPNNPDGSIREPVVKKEKGMLIYDLAYYWPQYTAITSPIDEDIMLFTASKCTGHAGSRIGWAIVKDENVAKKMVKFMELSTIGVSKEGQLRTASILEMISTSLQRHKPLGLENFFEHGRNMMSKRWQKLKDALDRNGAFNVPKFPTQYCNFFKDFTLSYPAFAWMKYKKGGDCEKVLRENYKIAIRSGRRFGSDESFSRVSMVSKNSEFEEFVRRLTEISLEPTN